MKLRPISYLAALAAVVTIAGCSSGSASPSGSPAPATGGTTATVDLEHAPRGEGNLILDEHKLTVNVKLEGLAPNSTHPAHIHAGTCNKQGPVLHPLNPVVANAAGTADVTTNVLIAGHEIPVTGWYINVHNGPELTPADQFLPIACANIEGNGMQPVKVEFTHGSGPSQNVSGLAGLEIKDNALDVTMKLSGLEPRTEHAAHIHSGRCESQGPVVYPFSTIVANDNGEATVTLNVPNVSEIPADAWYINVHRSTNLENSTGFDPIACGNVNPS